MNILALIPARAGSRGIPRKNIVGLGGRPLISFSIEVALASRLIGRVIVSTDSEEIRDISVSLGAEAPFLRPGELAEDDTQDLPVFRHALEWLEENEGYAPEIIVQLRPTTPLRRPEIVDRAIEALIDRPEADALRSVSEPIQNPFKMWKGGEGYLDPLMAGEGAEPYNRPRQSLPPVLWQNGYIDAARRETILSKNSMTGEKILPFLIDESYILDIDQPFSLKLAEFMIEHGRY
jgi:N-acylneuraminate cytidylyltransferase